MSFRARTRRQQPAPAALEPTPAASSFAWLHDPSVYAAEMASVGTAAAARTVTTVLPPLPSRRRRRLGPGAILTLAAVAAGAVGVAWLWPQPTSHGSKRAETSLMPGAVRPSAASPLPRTFAGLAALDTTEGDGVANQLANTLASVGGIDPSARTYSRDGVAIAGMADIVSLQPSVRGNGDAALRRYFKALGHGLPPLVAPGPIGGFMRCEAAVPDPSRGSMCAWSDGDRIVWTFLIHETRLEVIAGTRELLTTLR